jgi:hypothetical protein
MSENRKTRRNGRVPQRTDNGSSSAGGAATLTRLRYAEKAKTGHPIAKSLLLVLTRAADNVTRVLEISQAELARRVECDERTVRDKLCLLDARFIVREYQPSAGGRRYTKVTVLDLDEHGVPLGPPGAEPGSQPGERPVGLAGGLPVCQPGERSGPTGSSARVSKKASPSQRDLPDDSSSSKTHQDLPPRGAKAAERSNGAKGNRKPPARSGTSQEVDGSPTKRTAPKVKPRAPHRDSQPSPPGHSPAGPTDAEIRAALAAAPWPSIHEPCERLGLGPLDLFALGFKAANDGYLCERPDWYPHDTGEINEPLAEAWEAAGA